MNIKKFLIGSAAGALMFGSLAVGAFASTATVYDALPSVSPQTNYPSQAFQAQQTDEFGDYIHLGGTARILKTVTVTMSDWALYSDYASDIRYSGNSVSWTHPITLNIYSVVPGTPNTKGSLLGTVTQTITIPWRPVSGGCEDITAWKDSAGNCNHGLAFNATFDLSSLNVTLPDDIIVGIAFNTNTWGQTPIGLNGPYESLNVAVPPNQPVSVGSDYSNNEVFWNTHTCSSYADGGSSGCNIFREDTNWSPYGTVALQVTADEPTPTPTVQVHIYKYIDGVKATAGNANNAIFPMLTTFTSPNLGSYTDAPFTLSPIGWGSSDVAYEASFVGSYAGADYIAHEVTSGNDVVGASCTDGKPFALVGYSSGDSLANAQSAGPSSTVPNFTNLQSDHNMIVWNRSCKTPADANQCKKDGWKTFNNPTFKNQGDCVSYVQSNSHAVGNKSK